MLLNNGNYAVYNLQIRIVDLDEFRIQKQITLDSFTKNIFHINELNSHVATIIGTLNLINKEIIAGYNIFYDAKNGSYTQLLRLRKCNDKWYQASQLTKDNNVVLEKIDNDFPVVNRDKIFWEYIN